MHDSKFSYFSLTDAEKNVSKNTSAIGCWSNGPIVFLPLCVLTFEFSCPQRLSRMGYRKHAKSRGLRSVCACPPLLLVGTTTMWINPGYPVGDAVILTFLANGQYWTQDTWVRPIKISGLPATPPDDCMHMSDPRPGKQMICPTEPILNSDPENCEPINADCKLLHPDDLLHSKSWFDITSFSLNSHCNLL